MKASTKLWLKAIFWQTPPSHTPVEVCLLYNLLHLRFWLKFGFFRRRSICMHLQKQDNFERWTYLDELFKLWPSFSGSIFFPVPASLCKSIDCQADAIAIFFLCHRRFWRGDYGDARRNLLDFLIKELSRRVDNA